MKVYSSVVEKINTYLQGVHSAMNCTVHLQHVRCAQSKLLWTKVFPVGTKEDLDPWVCHTCFSKIAVISKHEWSENWKKYSREVLGLAQAIYFPCTSGHQFEGSEDPCLFFNRPEWIFRQKATQVRCQSKAILPLQRSCQSFGASYLTLGLSNRVSITQEIPRLKVVRPRC